MKPKFELIEVPSYGKKGMREMANVVG